MYNCLQCYESTLGSSLKSTQLFQRLQWCSKSHFTPQTHTNMQNPTWSHFMLIILAAVIIIILLLLLFTIITLVLTENAVYLFKKKCTTRLANRLVHSCIYCTLLFTIPEAFNILKNMATECCKESKLPPYLLVNCTVFISHLQNDWINHNIQYDTSYFDVITVQLLESYNSEDKPLWIRSYNETTT
jgi:hypothetical protein